jgi:hypothetical protein
MTRANSLTVGKRRKGVMTNTQSTPVCIETKFGKLYVAVATADPRSYHDTEWGNVTELRPELWVATDAEFDADPNAADHWTIRGRAHALHYHIIRDRNEWIRSHTPYAGGFRNDRRSPVEVRTKTWDLMWATLTEGLDVFAKAYPGWEELSRYMLHSSYEDRARRKAEDARREAAEHDKDAEGFKAAKDREEKRVPTSALALFPGWDA